MFPILLDDSYLASEFETFIDAIDKTHELTLGGHQQYPVWPAFLCFMFLLHITLQLFLLQSS